MAASPPIVLTTDFGLSDAYVGMMKGVILGINPQASITDLTHQIQPQNIYQAAFVLGASYQFFPQNSIHVVVVDPGVGTDRNAVLLVTPTARFLGPDNGVLSYVVAEFLDSLPSTSTVTVPATCAAYRLTNPDYWLHPVSNTFHGRDVFAPTAAHLSLGVESKTVGEALRELAWLPLSTPKQEGNRITGTVVYADHFGNLITNIPASMLTTAGQIEVEAGQFRIQSLSRTFHDSLEQASGKPIALLGSNGYLEIAVPDGNAAEVVNWSESATVTVLVDTAS